MCGPRRVSPTGAQATGRATRPLIGGMWLDLSGYKGPLSVAGLPRSGPGERGLGDGGVLLRHRCGQRGPELEPPPQVAAGARMDGPRWTTYTRLVRPAGLRDER